jgi:hypothetical protein
VTQLPSPLLLLRYGCHCGRMTGVMSGQGVVPVLLWTMHGHVHLIDGSECRSWGARGSPSCLRVPHAHRARWKRAAGGRALLMTPQGLGRGEEMSHEMPIVPEASPQGSGEIEFVVCASSG